MKKFLLMTFMLLPAVLCSEELKFVTVLSSPVGTFNRVEEVDSNTPVTSPVINFCTKMGSGNVQLNGDASPTVTMLNLAAESELGGTAPEYRLKDLTLKYGGTLKGSRLLANTVNANNVPALIKSSDIYASTLNVQGAKTVGLNVGNGKSVMSGTESNREMVWSNEYSCGDYTAGAGSSDADGISAEYVDPKNYLWNFSYIGGKPHWYSWNAEDESREYDFDCGCVFCFDEGGQAEWPFSDYKAYLKNPTLCSDIGVSSPEGLVNYVKSFRDPSHYSQDGLTVSDNFYNWSYIMNGHYGSNRQLEIVNRTEDSCYSNMHDIGPDPVAVRQKSYAMGCLLPAYSYDADVPRYVMIYCAFWKCRVWENPGQAEDCVPGTEDKYKDQFLLKSR